MEVEDVDEVDHVSNRLKKSSHSSVNKKGDIAIDNFMSQVTTDNDTKIKSQMMRASTRYSMMAGEHGLNVNQGALAILSTCVGGGILAIPLALYGLGIPLGAALNVGVIFSTHMSSRVYLGLRDLVPDQPDSLYEIGYMTVGRCSIFFLASIFIVNGVGLCLIYFISFGDTGATLVAAFCGSDEEYGSIWYTSRWPYTVFLGIILLPIVLKKELAEFAWISYVLFVSLTLFILLNLV